MNKKGIESPTLKFPFVVHHSKYKVSIEYKTTAMKSKPTFSSLKNTLSTNAYIG